MELNNRHIIKKIEVNKVTFIRKLRDESYSSDINVGDNKRFINISF